MLENPKRDYAVTYPPDPMICLDRKRYVIAVIGWHGRVLLAHRSLDREDALILSRWLAETPVEDGYKIST